MANDASLPVEEEEGQQEQAEQPEQSEATHNDSYE